LIDNHAEFTFVRPPAAVIFDLDGTLLDTERHTRRLYSQVGQQLGWPIEDTLYDRLIGLTSDDSHRILAEALGAEFPLEQFLRTVRYRLDVHTDWADLVKIGARALVAALRDRNLPVAVATSTARATARARLQAAGLLGCFATVVGGDEVTRGKPAPDLYLEAARRLGVRSDECLAFEDSRVGIESAHSAGMGVFHVLDLQTPTTRTRSLVRGVLASLAEVPLELFGCNNR